MPADPEGKELRIVERFADHEPVAWNPSTCNINAFDFDADGGGVDVSLWIAHRDVGGLGRSRAHVVHRFVGDRDDARL